MTAREFPNWEQLYQEKPVETMPWFNPELDPDVEDALIKLDLHTGTALDLGTGPGTQAIALAERGFQVVATDLSETAVQKGRELAKAKGADVSFQQDDILSSHLDRSFDFILDRGCFHVLPPERRAEYVQTVANLLKPDCHLLLKTFSHLETREAGPYRFTAEEIRDLFSDRFHLLSVDQTVYYGTLDPLPKALFSILKKR